MARTHGLFTPSIFPRSRRDRRPRRAGLIWSAALGHAPEALEDRRLLSIANVLVNNPAADTGSNDTQSETSLVLTGTGVLVAYNDSGSNTGSNKFTGYATSTDGGATFTDRGTLPTSANGDAGDPALARDNVSGKIYFATLGYNSSNVIQVFRSTDGGATFTAPVNGAPGFSSQEQLDKEWITVDNAPGAGQGTVYLTFTDFGTFSDNGIDLTRSTDGGNTWSTPISLGGSQGSYVTVGPDHAVYAFGLNGNQIAVRKSTDQGLTFGSAATVATLQSGGSNGDLGLTVSKSNATSIRSNAFPQAAVLANGTIVATYNDKGTATGDKADIFFTESTNGGASWSSPIKLNDDGTTLDQWQPALAVTPDGNHVGVFWYDRRNDPNDGLIDRYGVIGDVVGSTVTFHSNFKITDTSFPAVVGQDPVINSTYMGDYDVAAADNGAFYLTWGDNRLSDAAHAHQPDVRFAKIPLAGTTHFSIATAPASTTVGNAFSITVTALDANNNPDPTYRGTVHFTTTDNGTGVVLPANYTFQASDNGVHTFSNGVTLVTAGSQSITANDAADGSVNGSATEAVTPAAAVLLAVNAPVNATVGTPFTITLTARDRFGNTATGYTGTVHFTSTDTSASLPLNYTFTASDNGVHTFSNGVTFNSSGSQTITATDTVSGSITGGATVNASTSIQATTLTVNPSVTTSTAGNTFSVTVTARDNSSSVATGYRGTVHFTSTDTRSGVVLPANYTFTEADNGTHTFSGVTLVTAGNQSITAADTVSGSITGTAPVTVNPAAASQLQITPSGSSVPVNQAFTVTVTALDPYGNTATGYLGTVHFTSSQPRTKLPSDHTFTSADAGVFKSSVTFTKTKPSPVTLTVTDRANSSIAGSVSIAVTNSPLAGPGAVRDADAGADQDSLLNDLLGGDPVNSNRGLLFSIVLQELDDSGILDAYLDEHQDQTPHARVVQLRREIDSYLAGDVGFGSFDWL